MEKEKEERLKEIEQQLRDLQKAWIDVYEKVMRLMHDSDNKE